MQPAVLQEPQQLSRGHGFPLEPEKTEAAQPAENVLQPAQPPVVALQLSAGLPSSGTAAHCPAISLPEGQLVQPLPRPPSLMPAATLEAVGVSAPRQAAWGFQHATNGLFAPVQELPGGRPVPTLAFTGPSVQLQPSAAPRAPPAKGLLLSSSSGSLQLSCQMPPASNLSHACAAAPGPQSAPQSEGTSSDVHPSAATVVPTASDEAGAGSSKAPSGQQGGMRQVDSQSSLGQEESGSEREESGAKRRRTKKPRLVWSSELHQRFINAVTHLGVKNAVPKTILQLMNVDGMTRENVASHLQKYRQQLRRFETWGSESQVPQSAASQVQASMAAGAAVAAGVHGLAPAQPGMSLL